MNYYTEKQFLAQVDQNDSIVGKVDRWEAHKKRILHRAFSVCLLYKNQALLQHRKHLLFDGLFDFTCSSHPIYVDGKIEENEAAAYKTLVREWGVAKDQLSSPLKNKGSAYYQADDPTSAYGEHEVCYLFVAQIEKLPRPDFEYAYGYSLVEVEKLKDQAFALRKVLVPWVPHCLNFL